MMSTAMVALVGEQPMPILLPVKLYLREGDLREVRLVFTDRTARQARNLKNVLGKLGLVVRKHEVGGYDEIAYISSELDAIYKQLKDRYSVVYNLTGATKLMGLAAYDSAIREEVRFIYLQTEGCEDKLHEYDVVSGRPFLVGGEPRVLPGDLITIHEYIRVHTTHGKSNPSGEEIGLLFEEAVYTALEDAKNMGKLDELLLHSNLTAGKRSVEADIIVRVKNRVGVVEAKFKESGAKGLKSGIDQLMTATAREFLGTYTTRILVSNRSDENIYELAKAYGITFITLNSFNEESRSLSEKDKRNLVAEVLRAMRCA